MDDFLKECMSDPALVATPIPIDQFNKAYCLVCSNRMCSRSAGNNMSFDRRVRNWQEDLFLNVRRPDENDPNFANIRKKNFAPARESVVVGSNNFVSVPQKSETETNRATSHFVQAEDPKLSDSEIINDSIHSESETLHISERLPDPMVTPHVQMENTPFQQGTMLNNENPKMDAIKVEVVLPPGATFTFPDDE